MMRKLASKKVGSETEAPTSLHLIAFVALGKDHVVSEGEPIRSVR